MNVTNFHWYVGIDIGDYSPRRLLCSDVVVLFKTIQDSSLDVLEQKPGEKRLKHNYPAVMRAVPSKKERLHSGLC